MRPRLRILASAYACNPSSSLNLHPGEDLTGWRFVEQISRVHDVWVITHEYNRNGILSVDKGKTLLAARFIFLRLPKILGFLYKVEFGQRIYYYLWQILAWRTARRLHKKIGFDLAHHVTFGNDWIASYIGAFLPVPFLQGPVGGGQRTPRPLLREYSLGGRLSELGRSLAQNFGRMDPVRRAAIKKAKAILVCNKETREKIPPRHRAKAIYFPVNGISQEDLFFAPAQKGNPAPFRVFSAGRFHRLKGFALALRAFAAFAEEFSGAEMMIVGSGPEGNALRRVIVEHGLGSRVQMRSWLSRPELLRTMRSSDVLLFPSFRDGGGAVVVEAMASGKPVICLDSGGPGCHVQPEWGFKIPPASPEVAIDGFARALKILASDREVLTKMGLAAYKRAEDYYLWDRQGERLDEIYRKAVGLPGVVL